MDTEEVVQIYCQNEQAPHAPRHPRLCGFQRVFVPAGSQVQASIPVEEKRFLVVNDQGQAVQEGKVILYAGLGQPDERTQELTGKCSMTIPV